MSTSFGVGFMNEPDATQLRPQGEELSEHTASMPAVLHILQGEAKLTLGDDTLDARPGTWVHMPKGLRHSIQANTPVVMLLLLLK